MKRRLLIDCDGVMADFSSAYLNTLWEVTGRTHSLSEVTDFHFSKTVATPAEDAQVWDRIRSTPGYVRALAPYPGTLGALAALRELGEVVCVTSPVWGSSWADERFAWLTEFGFDKHSIVFASKKAHVHGDVLVDDHVDNLDEWVHVHGQARGRGVLIRQPWNVGRYHHHWIAGALTDVPFVLKTMWGID